MNRLHASVIQAADDINAPYPDHNPLKLERKLKREARRRGYGKKRAGAYVYGTMRKTGWKPGK